MRILTITAIVALPLLALGQTTEPQQTQQGQTKETQTTAPAKGKKMRPEQEPSKPQAKPETGANVRGQTNVKGRAPGVNRNEPGVNRNEPGVNRNEPGARSSTSQTNVRSTNQPNVNQYKRVKVRE